MTENRSGEVATPAHRDDEDPHLWPGSAFWVPPDETTEPEGVRITPGPGRGVTVELDRRHAFVFARQLAHYSGLVAVDLEHDAGVAAAVDGWERETWQLVLVDVLLAATRTAVPDEVVHVPIRDHTSAPSAHPEHAPESPSAEEPRP